MCEINLQKNTITDTGLFTLRRNQKKLMSIVKSPFKSLPTVNNDKYNRVRAGSEGPRTVDSPPIVRLFNEKF